MKRRICLSALVAGLALVRAGPLRGQSADTTPEPLLARFAVDPAGIDADYERLLELLGLAPARPWLIARASAPGRGLAAAAARSGPWRSWFSRLAPPPGAAAFRLLPVRVAGYWNSAYPVNENTGALWAGRGSSAALELGASFRYGPLTATLDPTVAYQENRAFTFVPDEIPGYSAYAYPWHGPTIDWPQRFGPASFWTVDPGQSALRLDARGVAIGISTENLWWGPARYDPLLMSATAPGIPHVFIGTSHPVNIGIGRLDGQALWGRLHESKYFDDDASNDRRLFSGIVLDLQPEPFPGLYLGGARTFLEPLPPGGRGLGHQLLDPLLASQRAQGTATNQLVELFARYAPPGSGLEVYAEWARQDGWPSASELLHQPGQGQGYTLGFQDVVARGGRWYRLYGELTHLGQALALRSGQFERTFYTHGAALSYTNRGQLIGAPIGPGSQAEILGGDVFFGRGRAGLELRRIRYDDDAYFARFAPQYDFRGHDTEFRATARAVALLGPFQAGGTLTYAGRYSRGFLGLTDGVPPTPTWFEHSTMATLELVWIAH